MVADDEFVLAQSAVVTSRDTIPTGGDATTTEITNASPGEWMPKLVANATGTLYALDDIQVQYQVCYLWNKSVADSIDDTGFYMLNLLVEPDAPGVVYLVSDSASDDTGVKAVIWADVALALASIDRALNGVSTVATVLTVNNVFRVVLRDAVSGALVTAVGTISIYVGAQLIGVIPPGYSHATSEFRFGFAATLGNMPELTTRREAPGIPLYRPNTPATRIYVKDDPADSVLGPGDKCALYCEETLQPGMESASALKRALRPYGTAL